MILNNVSIFIILLIFIISCINNYNKSYDVRSETSTIDNRRYIVSNSNNSQKKADILAQVNERVFKLIHHIKDENNHHIMKLYDRYGDDTLIENVDKKKFVAYSLNKGEKIALCLENKDGSLITDMNTLLFVIIHELAHIMCDTIGHTDEFWDHMKFLLEKGEEINIYQPINYKQHPKKYCGMDINSTPYEFN